MTRINIFWMKITIIPLMNSNPRLFINLYLDINIIKTITLNINNPSGGFEKRRSLRFAGSYPLANI
jgi:hypothetical protein